MPRWDRQWGGTLYCSPIRLSLAAGSSYHGGTTSKSILQGACCHGGNTSHPFFLASWLTTPQPAGPRNNKKRFFKSLGKINQWLLLAHATCLSGSSLGRLRRLLHRLLLGVLVGLLRNLVVVMGVLGVLLAHLLILGFCLLLLLLDLDLCGLLHLLLLDSFLGMTLMGLLDLATCGLELLGRTWLGLVHLHLRLLLCV